MSYFIKLFVPTASFLYPLKTSENLMVFWSSEGVENGCIGNEWVKFKYQDFDRLMSSAVSFHHVPIQKNCMKKCRNMEFFLVRMQENTDQKKLRIWTLFRQGNHCVNLRKRYFLQVMHITALYTHQYRIIHPLTLSCKMY